MSDDAIQKFIDTARLWMPRRAWFEFGPVERRVLKVRMSKCRMTKYPDVTGDPDGERCSGDVICEVCGNRYYDHPPDWRVIDYGNVPYLNVLCDGRRVKL